MMRVLQFSLTGLLALAMCGPAHADSVASPSDAITGGKLLLNLRPRYEHVEQDGKAYACQCIDAAHAAGLADG